MKRFLERVGRERELDLESLEFGLRQAVLSAGARLLENMLIGVGSGRREQSLHCECGGQMQSAGQKSKHIKTVLGDVDFQRSLYVCEACGQGRFPGDHILDVVGTMFSPGVRRLMARAGQRGSFRAGREDLSEFAGIQVDTKDVERVAEQTGREVEHWQNQERQACQEEKLMPPQLSIPLMYISYDGTGVPMVPWETAGRKGKQADGGSKTREAKLGCVFTQTGLDDQGRPVRDEASTTFVGAIETAEAFGSRIYGEALRRGLQQARQTVVIADGARYNWEIAALHFPDATQIVDLYHARQHLYALVKILVPDSGTEQNRLWRGWRKLLDKGRVDSILLSAQRQLPSGEEQRSAAEKEIGYFRNNAGRMRYGHFRSQGFFVGSGVVEAGCKTVVGQRLKQSGMEWTVKGANAIIALRCCHLSNRMAEFWEQRAA